MSLGFSCKFLRSRVLFVSFIHSKLQVAAVNMYSCCKDETSKVNCLLQARLITSSTGFIMQEGALDGRRMSRELNWVSQIVCIMIKSTLCS